MAAQWEIWPKECFIPLESRSLFWMSSIRSFHPLAPFARVRSFPSGATIGAGGMPGSSQRNINDAQGRANHVSWEQPGARQSAPWPQPHADPSWPYQTKVRASSTTSLPWLVGHGEHWEWSSWSSPAWLGTQPSAPKSLPAPSRSQGQAAAASSQGTSPK